MVATKKSASKSKSANAQRSAPRPKNASRPASKTSPASKTTLSMQQKSRQLLLAATFFVLSFVFLGMAYWRYHVW